MHPTPDRPDTDPPLPAAAGRPTPGQRSADGEAARRAVPREALGAWEPPADRADPIEILVEQGRERVPGLLPVRYGRMAASPFTFLRGAPAVLAHDLSTRPSTGLRTQLCGDAHLSNFGLYASPERDLVFDLNDFDETLPGPFEWDVARLCASLVVAARCAGQGDKAGRHAATAAARSYREQITRLADCGVMDIWYERIRVDDSVADFAGIVSPKRLAKTLEKARHRTSAQVLTKLTEVVGGRRRIRHEPPLIVPLDNARWQRHALAMLDGYGTSMDDDHRRLLGRFEPVEVAVKVVGVGSVGTRCLVVLLQGRDEDDVLVLQLKEAPPSVLAPFTGPSEYEHQGRRVVAGQRLMQAVSDVFLGWVTGPEGHEYYIRQLRDMKGSVDVDRLPAEGLVRYGELCGHALARAHARAGDPIAVAGYLGRSDRFDDALGEFATSYADQTERDHALLLAAIDDGRIPATVEPPSPEAPSR